MPFTSSWRQYIINPPELRFALHFFLRSLLKLANPLIKGQASSGSNQDSKTANISYRLIILIISSFLHFTFALPAIFRHPSFRLYLSNITRVCWCWQTLRQGWTNIKCISIHDVYIRIKSNQVMYLYVHEISTHMQTFISIYRWLGAGHGHLPC